MSFKKWFKQSISGLVALSLFCSSAIPSVSVTVNGSSYTIPQTNEKGWGTNVTSWIQGISSSTLQPTGGNFTLAADVNFGNSFGLQATYLGIGTAASSSHPFKISKSLSNNYIASLANTNTSAGTSFGLELSAGTNGSDAALTVSDTSSNILFQILGNGQTSVGSSPSSNDLFSINGTSRLSGTSQRGIDVVYKGSSSATSSLEGVRVGTTTANSTTHAVAYGFNSAGWTLGSGGAITNAIDYLAGGAKLHPGTNNASLADNNTFTGNWFINQSGSDTSLLTGQLRLAGLTASQAVVTDSSKNLASLAYATTNSANSLVQRDLSGNFAAGTITASGVQLSGLTASQAVVTDSSKNLASLAYATTNSASSLVERDPSGNFAAGTITASLTGTASGNLTYTANNHGTLVSGSGNTVTVVAPDSSNKVFVAQGASADPVWAFLSNSSLNGSAGITNANLATMSSSSTTVGTVKGNISGSSATPSDITLTSSNTASTVMYRDGSGNANIATLTAGTSLVSPVFSSSSANPATGGTVRLANAESIGWRTGDNSTNNTLSMNSSNQLVFGGGTIFSSSGTLLAAAFPALTGDITTSAGSLATTAAATQANISTLSRSAGVAVHGTNTNDNASSGYVGEYIEATQTTSTNVITNNTYQDLGSISLTAGDWDLDGIVRFTLNGATATYVEIFIGTVSGNDTTGRLQYTNYSNDVAPTATTSKVLTIPSYRVSISGSQTYYLKVTSGFSAGNPQYMGRFSARRRR